MLAYLNLSDTHEIFVQNVRQHQASILLTELIISALTLDPMNGELWVANGSYGGIFKCSRIDETCEDVFDSGMAHFSSVTGRVDSYYKCRFKN